MDYFIIFTEISFYPELQVNRCTNRRTDRVNHGIYFARTLTCDNKIADIHTLSHIDTCTHADTCTHTDTQTYTHRHVSTLYLCYAKKTTINIFF